jgi:hypothetical protein
MILFICIYFGLCFFSVFNFSLNVPVLNTRPVL